jgi:hypothetical protein
MGHLGFNVFSWTNNHLFIKLPVLNTKIDCLSFLAISPILTQSPCPGPCRLQAARICVSDCRMGCPSSAGETPRPRNCASTGAPISCPAWCPAGHLLRASNNGHPRVNLFRHSQHQVTVYVNKKSKLLINAQLILSVLDWPPSSCGHLHKPTSFQLAGALESAITCA